MRSQVHILAEIKELNERVTIYASNFPRKYINFHRKQESEIATHICSNLNEKSYLIPISDES